MMSQSNPKTTDNSRMQSDFPNPSDINNVIDSRSMFVPDNKIPNTNWRKEMDMNTPLPPQDESSSLVLAPPANRRITLDEAIEYELKHGRKKLDPNMDRKQLRRTISNRLSARRSQMKRSLQVNAMGDTVKNLEGTIAALTSQVETYKEKDKELVLQNESLQKLVEIRTRESRIFERLLEEKTVELCRLKEMAQTANNNSRGPIFGQEVQMQNSRFNQSTLQPFSLEFHENGLWRFETNQFSQEQLDGSALVQSGAQMVAPTFGFQKPGSYQQPGFVTKQPVAVMAQEKIQEEEEIDLFINFEELNLDLANI